jgi:hypothetical protein
METRGRVLQGFWRLNTKAFFELSYQVTNNLQRQQEDALEVRLVDWALPFEPLRLGADKSEVTVHLYRDFHNAFVLQCFQRTPLCSQSRCR